MVAPKLTVFAGAALIALVTPANISWTATLSPTGGSDISGTALVDVPEVTGGPADSLGRFDSLPPFQSDSARRVNPTPGPSRTGPLPTRASIAIEGAQPGEYPWQISTGRCGQVGTVAGNGSAYPTIRVYSDGRGSADASLAFTPSPGTQYSVAVLQSRTDHTVVACGLLEAGGELKP